MRRVAGRSRGISANPPGRFERRRSEPLCGAALHEAQQEAEPQDTSDPATELHPDRNRTIIARNRSPDLPFDRSINPYKGCEHGCVYCYARQTHAYLDLSPGLDFERHIFYKTQVGRHLRKALERPGYVCRPIALGTNTDPYQPVEQRLRITREVLELMLEYRHPVTIVTKGTLLARDIDLLRELAAQDLVSVMISITSLDAGLKARLEPRAAAPGRRLGLLRLLAEADVPAGVMVAPVIPALNDHELEAIIARSAAAGARTASYVLLRLPHEVRDLFRDWLATHEPMKAERVMALLGEMRGGRDYDARFGYRQSGVGPYADLLRRRFELALRRCALAERARPALRTDLFHVPGRGAQRSLFA